MYPPDARPDARGADGLRAPNREQPEAICKSFFVGISIVYSLPSIRYSESCPPISNLSRCSQFWNNCSYVTRR